MENKPSGAQPARDMSSTRLEGFSDGVLAVIITIIVLGLRPPAGADLGALRCLIPGLPIYLLSFAVIAS
jgi:uncharacterized membrane protein